LVLSYQFDELSEDITDDVQGWLVSLCSFPQDQLIQSQVKNSTPEPLIFFLVPSQLFELIRSRAIVLLTPTIVCLLCDADLTDGISSLHSMSSLPDFSAYGSK